MKKRKHNLYAFLCAYVSLIFLMAFECGLEELVLGEAKKYEMVFMLYLSGDNKREEDVVRIINKLEASEAVRKVQVVLLVDRSTGYYRGQGDWRDTRAYEVSYDAQDSSVIKSRRIGLSRLGLTTSNIVELDMGSRHTLADFVGEVKKKYGNNETKYALMIAGASEDWYSVGVDEENRNNALEIREIGDALNAAGGVDYLMLEDMPLTMSLWHGVANHAKVLVASPEYKPMRSMQWNFDEMLKSMAAHAKDETKLVQGMIRAYRNTELVAVRGSGVQKVSNALKAYATAMNARMTTRALRDDYKVRIRNTRQVEAEYVTDKNYFVDVQSLMNVGVSGVAPAPMQAAMKRALTAAVLARKGSTAKNAGGVLVYLCGDSKGQANKAAEYYKQGNAAAEMKFVKKTDYWAPNENTKSGLLYTLWFKTTF